MSAFAYLDWGSLCLKCLTLIHLWILDNNILLAVIIYSSVVNITFTVTPMSAPGSAALLTLFRLSGTHRCCPTWGFGFHPSLSMRECVPMQRCTLRLLVLWRKSHRFLVFLHIHDTPYSFRISPCPLCSLLWISGFWNSTEIDSLSIVGFFRHLLRLLIIIRSDTPIFW